MVSSFGKVGWNNLSASSLFLSGIYQVPGIAFSVGNSSSTSTYTLDWIKCMGNIYNKVDTEHQYQVHVRMFGESCDF